MLIATLQPAPHGKEQVALQKHAQQAGCWIAYLLLAIAIWMIIHDISFDVTGLGCALVFGFFETGFLCVVLAVLELKEILLPLAPKCWD